MAGRIFVSYRRKDTAGYAHLVYNLLSREFGPENVFMDVDTIEPGQDFVETLNRAVSICDVLVVLIGPQWLNIQDESGARRLDDPNDFVRVEIASAFKNKKIVIPVLFDGAGMPPENKLPEDLKPLARRQATRIGDHAADDVERLIESIKLDIQEYAASKNLRRSESFSRRRSKVPESTRNIAILASIVIGICLLGTIMLALIFGPSIFGHPGDENSSPTTSVPTEAPALTTEAPAGSPEPATAAATDAGPTQPEPPTEAPPSPLPPSPVPTPWTSVTLENIGQLELVHKWEEPHEGVHSIAFSPDGYKLATGSEDGAISLWSVPEGNLIWTSTRHEAPLSSLVYHQGGSQLASASFDGTVRLWSVADGSAASNPMEHGGPVTSVVYLPRGLDFVTGSFDGLIRIWEHGGSVLRTLEGHTSYVNNLVFSPDGGTLASASSDGTVRLWRMPDGTPLRTLTVGQDELVTSIDFSPDGLTLVSAGGGPVQLWRVSDGALLNTFDLGVSGSEVIWSIKFSPDGTVIALGGASGAVQLIQANTGKLLRILEHAGTVSSIAFAPNGPMLAIGCSDWNVYLWGIK